MKKATVLSLVLLVLSAFRLMESSSTKIPTYFPRPVQEEVWQLDSNKVELGRVLFYDPQFSADGMISCASCHSPYNAFAHTDHAISHGVFDSIGFRNAPALFNLAWQSLFMHDGAAHDLAAQALAPLNSELEMASSVELLLKRMRLSPLYRYLFQKAYRDSTPSVARALESLSAFQLSLISTKSKYDKMRSGLLIFEDQEERGLALFEENCAACHPAPLFSDYAFRSNGIALNEELHDSGRYFVSAESEDLYAFKTPSLRNLKYSFPYMHDGRFTKLRAVLNHYSPKNGDLSKSPLKRVLSEKEKTDIIAFLATLNDPTFVFNPRHAYPKWILSFNTKSYE